MTDLDIQRSPNPVDLHVGGRVRMRRKILGVSQEKLAEALGLTFQQVQKYERGANRISASKLYEIACFLSAPIAYFFEGLSDPESENPDGVNESGQEQFVHEFIMTNEGIEMAAMFPKIRETRVRRRLLELVKELQTAHEAAAAAA